MGTRLHVELLDQIELKKKKKKKKPRKLTSHSVHARNTVITFTSPITLGTNKMMFSLIVPEMFTEVSECNYDLLLRVRKGCTNTELN